MVELEEGYSIVKHDYRDGRWYTSYISINGKKIFTKKEAFDIFKGLDDDLREDFEIIDQNEDRQAMFGKYIKTRIDEEFLSIL